MRTLTLDRPHETHVAIPLKDAQLMGNLMIPSLAQSIVVFAHGSGSSRHSPRNRYVAKFLQDAGFATLLFDLLTTEEDIIDQETRQLRFDIALLAQRLIGVTDWLAEDPATARLKIGYFGASTGSAAALLAAAVRPERVQAVVSRGGRPDLAGTALTRIQVPTLLIVGEHDQPVLALNRKAAQAIQAVQQLAIVPGASHLFEEPGTLQQVAWLATQWFNQYLVSDIQS